jgi:2-polyprenyl-6-methoxyphenol hydroxylase-like FAD-dependent oxidoreductase
MTSTAQAHAVVVGAGLGGLTAAAALHARGWEVTVVERAPSLEPVGAGISVWPNALRALDVVGAGDAVRAQAALGSTGGIRRPDGGWLARTDLTTAIRDRFGDPLVVLPRAELVAALVAQLPDAVVQTGVTAREIRTDQGAVLLRTDRGDLRADLLVGADGIRSLVRRTVLPDAAEPHYAGYTSWRMLVPTPDGVEAAETWGRGGERFAIVPMAEGRCYCYATANLPAGTGFGGPDGELAELRRRFGDWHDPIPALLAAVRPSDVLRNDIEALDPPRSYAAGRVALLGDAAHAMTPDMGQGGCLAMEDAVVLAAEVGDARSLDRSTLPEALARYSAARRPRTAAIAARSRRSGRLYQAESRAGRLVRDTAARVAGALPAARAARALDGVVGWHPPA